MEITIDHLTKLLEEKIDTYNQLTAVLAQEKTSLENADVDALWKFSEEKQRLATRIAELRTAILSYSKDIGIIHNMNESSFRMATLANLAPKPIARVLHRYHADLISLKKTVQSLSEENKRFVQDYLNILDELLGIITNAGKPAPLYDNRSYCKNSSQTNLFVSREA